MTQTKTKTIVGIGLLTAIVIVLQSMAVAIRFGTFSITLVLVPIVVGASLYGWKAGAWLGLVFGVVVLFTDSAAFMTINAPGTIITCILKGVLAGFVAGVVYKALEKKNQWLAVITSAIVCPIVNTGVFLIGCCIFFMDTIKTWAAGAGFESVGTYMVVGFVGLNFLIEMGVNIVLSSAIVRILDIVNTKIKKHA
ncbi:MAG: ECF transporter S component [Oscillospiraceae bacterium]